jgi:hypothetical protein
MSSGEPKLGRNLKRNEENDKSATMKQPEHKWSQPIKKQLGCAKTRCEESTKESTSSWKFACKK